MQFVPHLVFALLLVAASPGPGLADDSDPAGVQLAQTAADQPAAGLVARGDALLALGDVSAARLFYELALDQGDLRAATAVAQTYDPVYLKDQGVLGMPGNPDMASSYYRRAIEAGDPLAVERLKSLTAWLEQ